jgi:hypothetical protein
MEPVVATDGNQRQIERPQERRKQAKTVAVGCDRLPEKFHGKEQRYARWRALANDLPSEKEEVDLLKTPSPANPKAHRT